MILAEDLDQQMVWRIAMISFKDSDALNQHDVDGLHKDDQSEKALYFSQIREYQSKEKDTDNKSQRQGQER